MATNRLKVWCVDMSKSYPFEQLQSKYTNYRSYRNGLSLLRAVNRHLAVLPDDHVYPRLYKDRAEDVVAFLLEKYKLPTPAAKRTKILEFGGIYSRIVDKNAHNPYRVLAEKVLHEEGPADPTGLEVEPSTPPPNWSELVTLFDKYRASSESSYITRVLCTLYRHGFVLRPEQIFHTSLVETDQNWMDLDGCKYTVRNQKNKQRTTVAVPKALCADLKALIEEGQTWLIPRRDGSMYRAPVQPREYGWPEDLPPCRLSRSSFRTYLKTLGPEANESYWNRVLGHSQSTAEIYYVKE
jgi:integrase